MKGQDTVLPFCDIVQLSDAPRLKIWSNLMKVSYITQSRFASEQLGDVSKVLLDGLYDAESPLQA